MAGMTACRLKVNLALFKCLVSWRADCFQWQQTAQCRLDNPEYVTTEQGISKTMIWLLSCFQILPGYYWPRLSMYQLSPHCATAANPNCSCGIFFRVNQCLLLVQPLLLQLQVANLLVVVQSTKVFLASLRFCECLLFTNCFCLLHISCCAVIIWKILQMYEFAVQPCMLLSLCYIYPAEQDGAWFLYIFALLWSFATVAAVTITVQCRPMLECEQKG